MSRLGLRLTPHGRLFLEANEDAPILDDKLAGRLVEAFAKGSGHGLMQLGAGEVGQMAPPTFVWWRDFAARYVEAICVLSPDLAADVGSSSIPAVPPPTAGELATL